MELSVKLSYPCLTSCGLASPPGQKKDGPPHWSGSALPLVEKKPGGTRVQLSGLVSPRAKPTVPASHGIGSTAVEGHQEPAGHRPPHTSVMRFVALPTVPGGQGCGRMRGSEQKYPLGHCWQSDLSFAPGSECVPKSHSIGSWRASQ
eukprot:3154020-Prymnesium_polylepis.3